MRRGVCELTLLGPEDQIRKGLEYLDGASNTWVRNGQAQNPQKRLIEAGFGIGLLSESHVADELSSSAITTIKVRDLSAKHNIVALTRHGGFLSAASRRLLDIIRTTYKQTSSAPAPGGDGRPKQRRRTKEGARDEGSRLRPPPSPGRWRRP